MARVLLQFDKERATISRQNETIEPWALVPLRTRFDGSRGWVGHIRKAEDGLRLFQQPVHRDDTRDWIRKGDLTANAAPSVGVLPFRISVQLQQVARQSPPT